MFRASAGLLANSNRQVYIRGCCWQENQIAWRGSGADRFFLLSYTFRAGWSGTTVSEVDVSGEGKTGTGKGTDSVVVDCDRRKIKRSILKEGHIRTDSCVQLDQNNFWVREGPRKMHRIDRGDSLSRPGRRSCTKHRQPNTSGGREKGMWMKELKRNLILNNRRWNTVEEVIGRGYCIRPKN